MCCGDREKHRKNAFEITSSILSITEKMDSHDDLSQDFQLLVEVSKDDKFLTNVIECSLSTISSDPTALVSVPTLDDLRMRFEKVKSEARKAGLAPKTSSGMISQALGNVFSVLTIAPKGFVVFFLVKIFFYFLTPFFLFSLFFCIDWWMERVLKID